VGSRLVQLTWKSGRAFVYDVKTLRLLEEFRYEGEGWGLAYDGASLILSDGTDILRAACRPTST
jgi:glutaminyl-peptide cyclotransferase